MNSDPLPHNSHARTALRWVFCDNFVLKDLPDEICQHAEKERKCCLTMMPVSVDDL